MPCFYVIHCFPEFAHLLLPAIFPSIRVFSNAAYWIPKCVSFLKIFFFFDGEHFLRVFTEFVTMLLLFHVLVLWPQGMWDLSFPTGVKPTPPALEGKIFTNGPPGTLPRLIHPITGSLYLLTNTSTIPLLPSPWQYHSTPFLWVQRFWIPHVSGITQYLSFCLAYLI